MKFIEEVKHQADSFRVHLRRGDGFVYSTETFSTVKAARGAAQAWMNWYFNVASSTVESVYYIVAIPFTWAGPPRESHRYSGLRVKIGRARDVLKRLANLRTGTSDDLIVHALEPGSAHIEKQRHEQFESDRLDQSREWFACSPGLTRHIWETWQRNNALPPVHQLEVLRLQQRIDALIHVRSIIGHTPDMVNPGLNESWTGKSVLVDLAFRGWRMSIGKPLTPGAIQVDPHTLIPLTQEAQPEPPPRKKRRRHSRRDKP